jgi:streptogramin lyase
MKDNMKNSVWKPVTAVLFSVLVVVSVLAIVPATATVSSRTYTLDADFDEGTLVGVEHETVHDQLQLSKKPVTLPFIWVPNTNEGTVSKVNTTDGRELGRYRVAPPTLPNGGEPSRTTVDLQGNCWVGNRRAGTVVKIGLYEAGQCIDRNGSGVIETSQDTNGDGNITGSELLPWGQDECVLYEVVLISGKEGTYAPGNYTGGYDTNYWGTAPRGLAIDASNNLWAGTWSTSRYYYIDGATGAILNTLDVSPWGHSAYGAVIDKNGILWSARLSSHILRINTANLSDIMSIGVDHTYGLGLDYLDHLFVGGSGKLTKINISDTVNPIVWTKSARTVRGVVSTDDNHVWVAGSDKNGVYNSVSRYDNDGNLLVTTSGFNAPSGVAVDAVGKVWVTDITSEYIHRINPATNTTDLSKKIIGSGGHYTYSDMTGIVSRTVTTKIGTWTVVFDSEAADTPWGTVSWNSNEPAGTSVSVKVRSSNDKSTWSAWETATNGVPLSSTPDGRYLEIETTLQILSGDVSPVLYDLTVEVGNQPPDVTNAHPSIDCLWPPNHKFVDITIEGVTDPDGDVVTITVTNITSDEPTTVIDGAGGAEHAPDARGVGADTASLRAERSGTENGRVYEITFAASDGIAETMGNVTVCVPHDRRKGSCDCIDDGQNYDATGIN